MFGDLSSNHPPFPQKIGFRQQTEIIIISRSRSASRIIGSREIFHAVGLARSRAPLEGGKRQSRVERTDEREAASFPKRGKGEPAQIGSIVKRGGVGSRNCELSGVANFRARRF